MGVKAKKQIILFIISLLIRLIIIKASSIMDKKAGLHYTDIDYFILVKILGNFFSFYLIRLQEFL